MFTLFVVSGQPFSVLEKYLKIFMGLSMGIGVFIKSGGKPTPSMFNRDSPLPPWASDMAFYPCLTTDDDGILYVNFDIITRNMIWEVF
ncbi:hypothetical protein WJM97_01215 [Okeanomitos corallinicola TIOX110]|uniref:Uncharacterized protein n=1 Tax=Okeanomitos corallinicola TIOX110 TaxID=3133117 RepID=A0ABZ2UTN7_9CYAN